VPNLWACPRPEKPANLAATMSDGHPDIPHRYSVIIRRHGRQRKKLWAWEIHRDPGLGVRIYGENFISPQAAKLAGEKALSALLESLPK
jgi:hypothetical protein